MFILAFFQMVTQSLLWQKKLSDIFWYIEGTTDSNILNNLHGPDQSYIRHRSKWPVHRSLYYAVMPWQGGTSARYSWGNTYIFLIPKTLPSSAEVVNNRRKKMYLFQKFDSYLYGAKFVINSDHKSLQYLFNIFWFQWHIKLHELFKAKAILVEGQ